MEIILAGASPEGKSVLLFDGAVTIKNLYDQPRKRYNDGDYESPAWEIAQRCTHKVPW